MRVLHIISGDLWAGAEFQVYTLLSTLQKMGAVTIAAVLFNDGILASRLREIKIPVIILPERQIGPLGILLRLRKFMVDWRPDVVHTHRLKENILGSLAGVMSHRPICVRTVHGAREHVYEGLRTLHKRLLYTLDAFCGRYLQQAIVAVSDDLGARLSSQFSAGRVFIVPNGIDISAVSAQVVPVDFRLAEPDAVHIGVAGRLVRVKRIDLFLRIAAELRRIKPLCQWRFHIFGEGPLRSAVTRQAAEMGIDDIATFHGHRPDIVACIAALDVLVLCSDHEGLPMVLLEAIAVGTPVVAHAVGGITEVTGVSRQAQAIYRQDEAIYSAAIIAALEGSVRSSDVELHNRLIEKYSAQANADSIYSLYKRQCVPSDAGSVSRQITNTKCPPR